MNAPNQNFRRKPHSRNRASMRRAIKNQYRAHGSKPEPANRWSSAIIMRMAGKPGMLSMHRSRLIVGYRWRSASSWVYSRPGGGDRECARRRRQMGL